MTDRLAPSPVQNDYYLALSRLLRGAGDFANKVQIPSSWPLVGGQGLGDLVGLPQAGGEVENWAYGSSPFEMPPSGTGGYVPITKANRKEGLAAVTGFVPTPAGPAGQATFILARPSKKASIELAEQLRTKGVSPRVIKQKTGLTPSNDVGDTRWLEEISDAEAKLAPDFGKWISQRGMRLGDVYDHPALYEAVPGLADTNVSAYASHPGERGAFYRGSGKTPNLITVNPGLKDPAELKNVVVHEGQHAADALQGLSAGGSPALFDPLAADTSARLVQHLRNSGMGDMAALMENAYSPARTALQKYTQDIPGEARAHVTEARAFMPTVERNGAPVTLSSETPVDSTALKNIPKVWKTTAPTDEALSAWVDALRAGRHNAAPTSNAIRKPGGEVDMNSIRATSEAAVNDVIDNRVQDILLANFAPGKEVLDPEQAISTATSEWIRGPLEKYLRNKYQSTADPLDKLSARETAGLVLGNPDIGAAHDIAEKTATIRTKLSGFDPGRRRTGDAALKTPEMVDALRRHTALGRLPEHWSPWNTAAVNTALMQSPEKAHKSYATFNPGRDPEAWLQHAKGDLFTLQPRGTADAFGNLTQFMEQNALLGALRDADEPMTLGAEWLLKHPSFIDPADFPRTPVDVAAKKYLQFLEAQRNVSNPFANIHKGAETFDLEGMPPGLQWRKYKADDPDLAAGLNALGEHQGHCVGGYCDLVKAGKTEIYSLWDKFGPKLTAEVEPARIGKPYIRERFGQPPERMPGEPVPPSFTQVFKRENQPLGDTSEDDMYRAALDALRRKFGIAPFE